MLTRTPAAAPAQAVADANGGIEFGRREAPRAGVWVEDAERFEVPFPRIHPWRYNKTDLA